MDTNKLRHFKTLFLTKNMREAAEYLNISHAGLSKSIKSLEMELGIELIQKDGRGLKLTEQGVRFANQISAILNEEDRLLNSIKNQHLKILTQFKISTFEVFSTYTAPLISEIFQDNIKELSFIESIPGEIEKLVLNGHADIGISYLPIPNSDLDHMKVTKIHMGVFSNGNKEFEKLPFSELPFVIPINNIQTPTKVKGLDGWPDDRIQRCIKYKVSLLETAISLVRKGMAVGYFPKFLINEHNNLVNKKFQLSEIDRKLNFSVKQDLYIIKRKNMKEDYKLKKIAKLLRSFGNL